MNIIFICTANRDRSRSAEIHFQAKHPEHRFRSAGINKYLSERHGGIHVKRYMLDVADRIVCAEHVHSNWIVQNIDKKYLSKIEIMELGDTETFMSEELIRLLEDKFQMIAEQS
jgi:predicted protein tyrosine phosphatase